MHAATCGGDVRAHWHGGPSFEYRRAVGAPAHFRVAPLREIRRLSNAIECRGGLGIVDLASKRVYGRSRRRKSSAEHTPRRLFFGLIEHLLNPGTKSENMGRFCGV